MASKPMVTLTLAGDEQKLTDAMNKVGAASKDMADTVGSSSKDMVESGKGLDDLAEKAGTSEQRFIGFKDSITGTQDILAGFRDGDLLTTAQGFADLAGGLESFLIPAIGSLTTALKVGLGGAMSFIAAHPLLITLGLLAGAFVLLWTNSETFRTIVMGVFRAVGDFIGTVVGGIVAGFRGMVGFLSELPGKIGGFFSSIGEGIKNAFRGAFNFVADIWNNTLGRINFTIPSWVPVIGGANFGIPKIPKFHAGIERVPGSPGQEMLAVLQAGEEVTSAGSAGGGNATLTVRGSGGLFELIANGVRTGDIQLEVDGVPVRVVA